MDVDAGRLTQVLAGRLAAIVPEGFPRRGAGRDAALRLWYGEPGAGAGSYSDANRSR